MQTLVLPNGCDIISESTQTDDSDSLNTASPSLAMSAAASAASAESPSLEEEGEDADSSEASSVIERLSRRVREGMGLWSERRDRATQTARDPLASETERLAFDIIFYTLGRRTGRASDDVARCLRTSVDRMLDKHSLVFNSMVGRLRVDRSSDLKQGFLNLSDELFQREEVRSESSVWVLNHRWKTFCWHCILALIVEIFGDKR